MTTTRARTRETTLWTGETLRARVCRMTRGEVAHMAREYSGPRAGHARYVALRTASRAALTQADEITAAAVEAWGDAAEAWASAAVWDAAIAQRAPRLTQQQRALLLLPLLEAIGWPPVQR